MKTSKLICGDQSSSHRLQMCFTTFSVLMTPLLSTIYSICLSLLWPTLAKTLGSFVSTFKPSDGLRIFPCPIRILLIVINAHLMDHYVTGREKEKLDTWCVWVMKDRWVKLISIRSKKYVIQDLKYYPIAYRRGSRHEVLCKRKFCYGIYWYNIRDKVATNAKFKYESGYFWVLVHVVRLISSFGI